MIRFEKVRKVYEDGFVALKNINLEFKEGELTVLIGPSGCGKTTLMKLINRLNHPSQGKVLIRNKDISGIDPIQLRRSIGYVIQSIGLFPHMTIAANVGVVPRLLHWDKDRIDQRVDELLRLVHLDPDTYRNRYPAELSGGQQQRIGIIRALAANPEIILLDEPFSALDPISREQLQDELIRLQQDFKHTIVFVTHDMDEALKIADTIVLMKEGEVVQTGRPEQILRHPADDFVRNFIGKKRLQTGTADQLLKVDDVMTENAVTAYPTRGLAEAIKLMEKRKVDSLIVVDRNNDLLGYASIFSVLDMYREEFATLADVMSPFEHVVESGMPVTAAISLMNEHRLPYVPVLRNGRFAGLITKGSLVRHLAEVYAPAESTESELPEAAISDMHWEQSTQEMRGGETL
ncbi:betaine/proline/choline family ABC transporter ATP-binding protein [Paenibacillus naphthalenovorans]|uniref:Quaternary amine transport ATP-binding protein n=1 Tax=Paenibacillus naphthalenovorans TaxID=162209 RepID=A0A0U2VEA0_9BACL|nr:betaine/proline/choline family ABC transporter ATP-binding protein [Paenibacillus naphthalenovorans]ALS21843.1 ABC transporter ATP-binding protein [Paenibacillus naphthalenovorans]